MESIESEVTATWNPETLNYEVGAKDVAEALKNEVTKKGNGTVKSLECEVTAKWNPKTQKYEVPAKTIAEALKKEADKQEEDFRIEVTPIMSIKKEETFETKVASLSIKNKVYELYRLCYMNGDQPWQDPNCIIGEAPRFDICYDKIKLDQHKDEILAILGQLGSLGHYYDLAVLSNGQHWTEMRQPMGLLLTMANAIDVLDFDRDEYVQGEENPKLITKNKSDEFSL